MKRDTDVLAAEEYDLLIVGAGIYGACAARDAALRGLKVAVIERGDFGGATSQNSLKIIHGGLRYLQQADLVRMRESIRERRTLMKIAPQFVHPLPCLMPTYGHFTKGREALFIAMLLNDIISLDRNRLGDPGKFLPRSRVIPRRELLDILPGAPRKGLTGGALWHDCQTHNSERLLLSFLLSAASDGARMANYLELDSFLTRGRRVVGVRAIDRISGKSHNIRARIVLNATGPWVNKVLSLLPGGNTSVPFRLSTALNIVTRKFIKGPATGIESRPELIEEDALIRKGSHVYFIAPWRHVSIVGTVHAPYNGDPDGHRVAEKEIRDLLDEINRAYPAAKLNRDDVYAFYGGLLPMKGLNRKSGEVNLLKHYRLADHETEDGWQGLVSLVGVKYTTARDVGQKTVDLVRKKLKLPRVKSTSSETPVYGGRIESFHDFVAGAILSKPEGVSPVVITHLVYHYGSCYPAILDYGKESRSLLEPVPGQGRVTGAEVVHAVREEMALHLEDVMLRRTELGSAGMPGSACMEACAKLMARELGWDEKTTQREIENVKARYKPRS